MSTLSVSNITDGTDTVETGYVVNGSAKAWVNFNSTGTIATRDSFNVSSLTDNGTGNYDVNFSSDMANEDYSAAGVCGTVAVASGFVTDLGDRTVSVFGVTPRKGTDASAFDFIRVGCTIHGDLA